MGAFLTFPFFLLFLLFLKRVHQGLPRIHISADLISAYHISADLISAYLAFRKCDPRESGVQRLPCAVRVDSGTYHSGP